jgi:DNA-binding response OmpR family regulator
MTVSPAPTAAPSASDPAAPAAGTGATHRISVLLYSDDIATRDAVRVAVGRRPARDVEVTSWRECATAPAVIEAVESGAFDLLVLDGEAAPVGGLGLCRQLKNEIFECPPVLVLTGRPQDGWLAAWSQADLAVPHPLDPISVAAAVAELARTVGPSAAAGDRVR